MATTRHEPNRQPVRRTVRPQRGSRYALFLAGELKVDDLTDEELLTGRLNDHEGMRRGRPPKLIPVEFHQAIVKEALSRGERLFRESFLDAISTFVDIATSPNAEDKDRLRAAQYIIERIAGKVPEKVEHSGELAPWQIFVQGLQQRPTLEVLPGKERAS